MATARIGRLDRLQLYITEHLRSKDLSDERAAGRIGVDRATVFKWRKNPYKLSQEQLEILAKACDLKDFRDFYRPPGRPSVDAVIDAAPAEVQDMITDVVQRLVKQG